MWGDEREILASLMLAPHRPWRVCGILPSSAGTGTMLSVDDGQRCRAIEALLGVAGMGHLWSSLGPTRAARRLREADELPVDERVMLSAAWALWDGSGAIHVSTIDLLDERSAAALSELVIALGRGPVAVDAWLARYAEPAEATAGRAKAPSRSSRP